MENEASKDAPASAAEERGAVTRFRAQDGLTLAARIFGQHESDRLPILCLPGLSRNSKDFISLGSFFNKDNRLPRQVFALDYRGRGHSDPDPDWTHYSPLVEARDVLAAADTLGVHKAVVVGTSRGGIIAMILGAMRPGLMAGVVLNDIGPVIEGTGLARIKTYLASAAAPKNYADAIERLKRIAGAQFPALDQADWAAMADAIYRQHNGRLELDFDSGLIKSANAIDLENAIPTLWPQFDSLGAHPVLSLRGENSDVLSKTTVAAMVKRHSNLEAMTVPGQGHAPLLRDASTLKRIAAFALRCDAAQPRH